MTDNTAAPENNRTYQGPPRLDCNHASRESLERQHRFLPAMTELLTQAYGAEGTGWGFDLHTEPGPVSPRNGSAPRGTQIPDRGNVVIYPDGDRYAHETNVMQQPLMYLALGRASISR